MAAQSRLPHIELRARFNGQEDVAFELWIVELHASLRRKLRRIFPHENADDVADAATDAILAHLAQPHSFDETRRVPLEAFVCGIATHMMRTRARSRLRRSLREGQYCVAASNSEYAQSRNNGPTAVLARQLHDALGVLCSADELAAMQAWLGGHDDLAIARLTAHTLPFSTPRHELELLIKRVTKRLRRYFRDEQKKSAAEV